VVEVFLAPALALSFDARRNGAQKVTHVMLIFGDLSRVLSIQIHLHLLYSPWSLATFQKDVATHGPAGQNGSDQFLKRLTIVVSRSSLAKNVTANNIKPKMQKIVSSIPHCGTCRMDFTSKRKKVKANGAEREKIKCESSNLNCIFDPWHGVGTTPASALSKYFGLLLVTDKSDAVPELHLHAIGQYGGHRRVFWMLRQKRLVVTTGELNQHFHILFCMENPDLRVNFPLKSCDKNLPVRTADGPLGRFQNRW
jgi:hypothetical protein